MLVFPLPGIVYSCYLGIGSGVGTIICGFTVDLIGGSFTFLVFGAVTFLMLLFSLVTLAISKFLERRQKSKETDDQFSLRGSFMNVIKLDTQGGPRELPFK